MTDRLERNKKNAMAFYELMFNQSKPREAMARYAGAQYLQHNPDGSAPFIDIFRMDAGGKVLERWDVLQVVPAKQAHSNGMF